MNKLLEISRAAMIHHIAPRIKLFIDIENQINALHNFNSEGIFMCVKL